MASAPIDVPVQVKGLSDLQKLERRMEALEKEVTRLNKALPKTARELASAGRSAKGAAVGIKAVGTAVKTTLGPLVAATAAIGGLVKGFQTIAGQDFAAAKVRSLGVDSQALVASLKLVSAELQGNASVAELTAAAYDVASAGFTDAADAAMVLKAASLGAVGGFSDINTVGDAATSVLNAYGKSAKEAGALVDGFIQTQNDGKVIVDAYARNIGKVASAAAGLKIPIEEVNTVIAQSTASGVQAEIAFTGLKGALARLASGEAAKALKEFGITIDSASLEADGLLGTLEKFKSLDTGTVLKALGTEAGPALLPVINNLEKAQELLQNQKNSAGAAARAQQEAANTINGAWNRVGVAFENLFTNQSALAQAIIPILDGVAEAVNGISFALEQWKNIAVEVDSAMKELAATAGLVGDAFGALGNAIGWAVNQLGRLIMRGDGMEQFQALGRDRFMPGQMASFGADYKEQEAALFKAASGGSSGGSTSTAAPGFSPSASGGGAAGSTEAQKLADQEARRLAAAKEMLAVAQAEIGIKQALTPVIEAQLQSAEQVRKIEQEYAQAIQEATSAETIKVLETAKGVELQLEEVKLEQQLADIREGAASGIKDEIEMLEARLNGTEDLLRTEREIAKLKNADVANAEGLVTYRNQLEQQVEAQDAAKESAEQLAGSIASGLTSSLRGLIDGSMSAEEAMTSAFKSIADSFLDMAMQMIQEWLTMQLLGIIGGVAPKPPIPKTFAEGGYVDSPTSAVIGEAGESEYVIPSSKMDGAMARYSSGARGDAVLAGADSDSAYEGAAVAEAPMSINITGGVTQMGGNDYIRQDELPSIIGQASKAGEARALRRLRQSPSARRSIGL